jgi:hypothetical protein
MIEAPRREHEPSEREAPRLAVIMLVFGLSRWPCFDPWQQWEHPRLIPLVILSNSMNCLFHVRVLVYLLPKCLKRKERGPTTAIRHEARRIAMSVVRHQKEAQRVGQPASATRQALPATASADPEPLTNGL